MWPVPARLMICFICDGKHRFGVVSEVEHSKAKTSMIVMFNDLLLKSVYFLLV